MHLSILTDFFDLLDAGLLAANFYDAYTLNIKQGLPSFLLTPFSFLYLSVFPTHELPPR